MSFDYRQFLKENQLTSTSRLRSMFEEDELDSELDSEEGSEEGDQDPLADYFADDAKAEEPEAEPTSADMKGDDVAKDATANQGKLQQLIKQKDEILAQYKNGSLSLDQYRTKIGNIPQQIKQLQAKLDPVVDDEEEELQEAGPAVPPAPKAVDRINFQSVNSGDISDAASYAYTLYNIATKLKSGEKFNPESDQNIKTALQLLRKAAKLAPAAPELPKK